MKSEVKAFWGRAKNKIHKGCLSHMPVMRKEATVAVTERRKSGYEMESLSNTWKQHMEARKRTSNVV